MRSLESRQAQPHRGTAKARPCSSLAPLVPGRLCPQQCVLTTPAQGQAGSSATVLSGTTLGPWGWLSTHTDFLTRLSGIGHGFGGPWPFGNSVLLDFLGSSLRLEEAQPARADVATEVKLFGGKEGRVTLSSVPPWESNFVFCFVFPYFSSLQKLSLAQSQWLQCQKRAFHQPHTQVGCHPGAKVTSFWKPCRMVSSGCAWPSQAPNTYRLEFMLWILTLLSFVPH